jgi:hypothetical protein
VQCWNITPWWRELPEKLPVAQLLYKFHIYHGTKMFFLSQSNPVHIPKWYSCPILKLSFHLCSPFLSTLLIARFCAFLNIAVSDHLTLHFSYVHPQNLVVRHLQSMSSPDVRSSFAPMLIRHRLHKKRCVQQFFYCCVYIRWRRNVFTGPLPSNYRGETHNATQTARWSHKPTFTYSLHTLFWRIKRGLWY